MPAYRPAEERFLDLVDPGDFDGCWEWLGHRQANGYSKFSDEGRTEVYAHRYSYEFFYGPIPEDMELDHLCRNRACVSPFHLEIVSHSENVRRGWAFRRHRERSHEALGQHGWTPEIAARLMVAQIRDAEGVA